LPAHFNIGGLVADDKTRRQIKVELPGRALDETGLGFAAGAVSLGPVRAKVNPFERDPFAL
jgi:hypothetical protein